MWPRQLWQRQLSSQGVGWALSLSLWENGGGLGCGVRGTYRVPCRAGDQIPALALGCKRRFLLATLYFIQEIQEVFELCSKAWPSRVPITTMRSSNHPCPHYTREATGRREVKGLAQGHTAEPELTGARGCAAPSLTLRGPGFHPTPEF